MKHRQPTKCIEICEGDKLYGYVIFFSGGWDAYLVTSAGGLRLIGRNYPDQAGGIRAVHMGRDWRQRMEAAR